jgi:hypothetical protein
VPQIQWLVGAPAIVPELWARRLLRQLTEQARDWPFSQTHDPVMQSFEPGEDWGWCYVDEVFLEPAPLPHCPTPAANR